MLRSKALTAVAFLAAVATVLITRLLAPAALFCLHLIDHAASAARHHVSRPIEQPPPAPVPPAATDEPCGPEAVDPQPDAVRAELLPLFPGDLESLTCRQLQALAGVRRRLPKRQLIDLVIDQRTSPTATAS